MHLEDKMVEGFLLESFAPEGLTSGDVHVSGIVFSKCFFAKAIETCK